MLLISFARASFFCIEELKYMFWRGHRQSQQLLFLQQTAKIHEKSRWSKNKAFFFFNLFRSLKRYYLDFHYKIVKTNVNKNRRQSPVHLWKKTSCSVHACCQDGYTFGTQKAICWVTLWMVLHRAVHFLPREYSVIHTPSQLERNQGVCKNHGYFHKPITEDFCILSTWTLVLQGSVIPSQELSGKAEMRRET